MLSIAFIGQLRGRHVLRDRHAHAFGADGGLGNERIETLDIQIEQCSNRLRGVGQVHGANQWQPTAGRQRGLQTPAGVDVAQQLQIPLASTQVEVTRARGIAILSATTTGGNARAPKGRGSRAGDR